MHTSTPEPLPERPDPWELQPGEPVEAFAAFAAYRDAGPAGRSLAKVGQSLGKSVRVLEDWSVQWQWVSRTRKWVAELDRIMRDCQLELLRDMQKRHIRIACAFQEAVSARLELLDVNDLKPADMARWFEVAVKVERLALGEETDIVSQRFRSMSDSDLMEYLRRNMRPEDLPEAPLTIWESGEAAEA